MIFHILKKDARRLWPAIAGSLAVLAALAWQDRWRSDFMPSAAEGYLNLLMPLVWAAMLGLAVEQEPIAGDRQFWITRPYRRSALLGAKLLFAVLFVHLPSLVADCYILAARGFSPFEYGPELLAKQLVLVCALTLPSLALASLVRSFSHFILELVAVAAVFLVLSGTLGSERLFSAWEPFVTVRWQAMVLVLAVAATMILYLQYRARRLLWSRTLAAIAAAGAMLLFSFFLPQSALAIRAAVAPARVTPSILLDTNPHASRAFWGRELTVQLPIVLTGYPEGTQPRVTAVESEIATASGLRLRETMITGRRLEGRPYFLYFQSAGWITLQIKPSVFTSLASSPVTLRGVAGVRIARPGGSTSMGVGETREVSGVGRCTTSIVEVQLGEEMIKLECESPRRNPYQTRARLTAESSPLEWNHTLGDSRTMAGGPMVSWLSPLHRDQTFWHLASEPQGQGARYLVPRHLVSAARIEVFAEEELGYARVKYEFRDLDLHQYVGRPPNPLPSK